MEVTGRPRIRGVGVDAQGRCAHYHREVDVVALWCVTCQQFWACHACHEELANHRFGRAPVRGVAAVLCGACGFTMEAAQYQCVTQCPACGHGFNPGCAAHASRYFM
ncbi:CHY zinc finger protein [Corynebacterium uberis]|uniref:CHY zinc finger protein n=1 Tax=Corynebacterium TaxID=1716 RepID=UPI001D0A2AA5|nr:MULTISPECIES: CHY zinc finger protein [Corynebacterium]MCZ9310117.1 CHY zinc finger protein [Corynebacterium sp. c6VSa_13]UDL73261.1 hypothetical protein LH391_09200 [Corynebacterium uberis]UDL75862.1 hypothetical protein LH393_00190 [Corynebacterium uberis]UDL78074.1 hypothetical protein LH394_00185 [Corynebacterium uberis]UDL80357.1 hypothetical protein LH392_00615 [Corynebacterium uberis]